MKHDTPVDYYAVLGVPKSASTDEIKRAYRKLATRHHPDRAGSGDKIVLINEAYATLKDANSRAKYDAYHAVYFSVVGKTAHKVGQKIKQSPTVMANLQKIQSKAHQLVQAAEHELHTLGREWRHDGSIFKNAKILLNKAQAIFKQTQNRPNQAPNQTLPVLIISTDVATHGGQIGFVHRGKSIRTMLPKGLSDGVQIKLVIDGVAVWFLIKVAA